MNSQACPKLPALYGSAKHAAHKATNAHSSEVVELLYILHTATIVGFPVRFSKAATPGVELPWQVMGDLPRCQGTAPGAAATAHSQHPDRPLGAGCPSGPVEGKVLTLAPHYMAQRALAGMVEKGMTPASLPAAYTAASAEAFEVEADPLRLDAAQFSRRLLQAVTGRNDPGITLRINATTGEAVFNVAEVQAALSFTDEEVAQAVREMEARGHAFRVDPSKLATIQ